MLTCKSVSPKKAVSYFLQGYYQKGSSRWSGKEAKSLGLSGEITDLKEFQNIVEGYSPDRSQQLTGKNIAPQKRRAALDCTLSAPKSVSLTALVAGDKRLITAHRIAVEKTLNLMQERYAHTRVRDGENRNIVNTGNLLVAQFDHIETRELDPHLHTHCLVMNMTKLPNDKWYSHLNEGIYANKKMLGMAYQNYLAAEVEKLGYSVEWKQHGQFDIAGYAEQDLVEFSKRRQQILAAVGPNSSWLEREKAWDATRKRKENINPEELITRWQQEAIALGTKFVQPVLSESMQLEQAVAPPLGVSQLLLESAIKHCSEREVAFKQEKLEEFILEQSITVDVTELEPQLRQHLELIRIPEQDGVRYTTQTALQRELATIQLMQAGQGAVEAIAPVEVINAQLENTSLNAGQRQAVMLAATTTDLFMAWQGVAGAGKTYSVETLKEIAQARDYKLRGFAPSAQAAKVLGDEAKIETNTVAGLLVSKLPEQIEPNQIWIVDEAGLLSAKDAHALLQRATSEQARVILIGDTRQLSAVEAGNPFKSLQQAGIVTAYLNESQRQKKAPQLKLAVDLIASGNIAAGFEQLKASKCITTVTADTKIGVIATDYMAVPREARNNVLMLAGTNAERLELTQEVRSRLKVEGSLGAATNIRQLKARDLTTVQMEYTNHIAVGDVVMPLRSYKRRGLNKGELYEVIAKNTDHLQLKGSDGAVITTDAGFKKAVYQQQQMEIAVGEKLKWTKNERTQGRRNGQEFTVTAIDGKTAEIQYSDNEHKETINLELAQHLDYALVSTTYSSQGKTADQVLIAADSTVSKESFYVAVSRARFGVKLYTENPTELLELAELSRAKENVLDVLRSQMKQQVEAQATAHPALALNSTSTAQPPTTVQASNSPFVPPVSPPKYSAAQAPPVNRSTPRPVKNQRFPKHSEAFWTPTSASEPPRHIDEKHWRELVEGSAIHPDLVELNIDSVTGRGVYERLLSTKLEQIGGSGQYVTQPAAKLMKAYELVALGGWWAEAGIDARSLLQIEAGEKPRMKLWGCFKADNPRIDADKSQRKGKTEYIKYEHPLAEDRQLFLFNVPEKLAERIYEKYGIQPTAAEKQSGFWYIVHHYNLPIKLAEGAKKTLSSLSQGEITIGLSGVNGGYFAKGKDKERLSERVLHPELKIFATPGREFTFTFDHDTKASTIWNVRRDLVRIGELLEKEGSSVRVAQWQGDKGLDDLIVNQGALAYADALSKSIPLARDAQKHYRGEYSRLSRRVRDSQPSLSGEAIDIEVYKLALLKGDNRDGARTITQSDTARLFKSTLPEPAASEKTLSYIQQIEDLVFRRVTQQPQPEKSRLDAAESFVPPQNLNAQKKESLLDKSTLQQPTDAQTLNKSNEQNYGINTQTTEPEHAANRSSQHGRDGLTDREDHAVGSKQLEADGENQFPGEQQHTTSREVAPNGIESNREFERAEDESQQLLAATSRDIEQQEAEQDGAAVEGIDRSLAERWFPSRVAAEFPRAPERQDSASLDSTASDVRIEQQAGTAQPPAARECLDALTNYAEVVSIESALLPQSLIALADNLKHYQSQETAGAMQALEKAISNYLKQPENQKESTQTYSQVVEAIALYLTAEVVETGLATHLEGLTKLLGKLQTPETTQTPLLNAQAHEPLIEAIALSLTAEVVETGLAQKLEDLTKQLSNLPAREIAPSSHTQTHEQTIEAIADYLTAEVVEAGLAQDLQGLTKQLGKLQTPETTQTPSLNTLAYEPIVEAIADYLTAEVVETGLAQKLEDLTKQLSNLPAREIAPSSHTQTHSQVIEAIALYLTAEVVEVGLARNLQGLTKLLGKLETPEITQTPSLNTLAYEPIVEAIANYLTAEVVEAGLAQKLEGLTKQLSNPEITQPPSLNSLAYEPIIEAIADYTQVEAFVAESLLHLSQLTQQLSQLPEQGFESTTVPEVIAEYIEQQSVEGTNVTQALESLTQLLQQLPEPGMHTDEQIVEAIALYVEQQSVEGTNVTQSLELLANLLKSLPLQQATQTHEQNKQVPHQNVDSEQNRDQAIEAISQAIELEAVAADEVVSALSRLKTQLSVLPEQEPDEHIDVALPNNEQVIEEIANYLTKSAISAQPITEAVGELSQQLEQQKNSFTQPLETLDAALSSSLQRLETTIVSLQQENTLQLVEALSSFTLESAVESAITPQTLQALIDQLQGLQHPELTNQMQQLEAVVKDVETQLVSNWQQKAAKPIVEAISNYGDTTATESEIAPELQQLIQELAVVDNFQLGEQLQQLGGVIEQYHESAAQLQSREKSKTTVELAPQVFMGSKPNPDLLKPIQNHGPVYKPIGGIWTSPQQSEYGSEWSAFVHKEGMTVQPHKQQLWLVVPKPDLNILVVDSPEKLKALPHLPPRIPGDDVCPLDYEAIASEYDALVIKPQLLRGNMEVASFDVESTIWFGSRGYPFASVEPLALVPVQQQVSQVAADVSPVNSTRADLNTEQQPASKTEVSKQYEHWKLVVQALGKPEVYINRVAATAKLVKAGGSIPKQAVTAMQQDFQTYLQTSDDLLNWHKAAQALGKSEQYLEQIRAIAHAFHAPSQPKPLSPKTASTMQQDLQKHEQQWMRQLWQQYSQALKSVSPMLKANAVASAALKDGHTPEMILKILKHDPQLPLIRQRSGEQAVQTHLKISLQSALAKAQRQSSLNQVNRSRQHKQERGFEL